MRSDDLQISTFLQAPPLLQLHRAFVQPREIFIRKSDAAILFSDTLQPARVCAPSRHSADLLPRQNSPGTARHQLPNASGIAGTLMRTSRVNQSGCRDAKGCARVNVQQNLAFK